MKQELLQTSVGLKEGVQASFEGKTLTLKGPKGEVKRDFGSPNVEVTLQDQKIVLSAKNATKREKKLLFTFAAHMRNMNDGVADGVVYKLKICSGHFPMTVSIKGDSFEVKNFIGESIPRKLKIREGASVKIDGETIVVEGVDKELTAQTAADIENLCKRPGFDKRIFQDGLYIIEKNGKVIGQ